MGIRDTQTPLIHFYSSYSNIQICYLPSISCVHFILITEVIWAPAPASNGQPVTGDYGEHVARIAAFNTVIIGKASGQNMHSAYKGLTHSSGNYQFQVRLQPVSCTYHILLNFKYIQGKLPR